MRYLKCESSSLNKICGNIVEYDYYSIETISHLLYLKIFFPKRLFLIREFKFYMIIYLKKIKIKKMGNFLIKIFDI